MILERSSEVATMQVGVPETMKRCRTSWSIPIVRSGVSTTRRAGDVTLLVAEIVGSAGHVVGSDRVPAALAAAERRSAEHSLQNVSFREGDPAKLTFEQPFDAVVGRYVLMFQADPAAMLRGVARHLRPGGTIVFHEPAWDGAGRGRRHRLTTNAADGSSRHFGAPASRPKWA